MKKKKSYKRRSKREQKRSLIRIALRCLGVGFCLFLLCSCLSFDLGDWPSRHQAPHNEPAANWCGSIGAFCAYQLLYYIGPGIFVVLVAAMSFLVIKLANRETGQPILRTIGLVLVTVAASMSFYCLWPGWLFGFRAGSGGVLGVGLTQILRGHFASLGTFILLVAVWIVGVILLAERLIGAAVPAWSAARQHSQVLSEIWRELSAKQKPVVLAEDAEEATEEEWEEDELEEGEAAEEVAVEEAAGIEVRRTAKKKRVRPSAQPAQGTFVQPSHDDYELPPLDLLAEPEHTFPAVQEKVVKSKAADLETLLSEFSINAKVVAAETGPVVTMFELELAAGVKVSQISALSNDMARALAAGAVRVVAPLPGKHTIGIEVPNSEKERVRIKNMMELAGNKPQNMQIPLYLGKDSSGEALVSDLTKMPHLLIAGTTGSGKSVCINSVIVGVLLTKRPDEVKMILIDPKMVEMTAFNTIPHLMCPIVTETKMAVQILEWATVKMDERYAILAEAKVKNVSDFNKLGAEEISKRFGAASEEEEAQIPKKLPYIVIIIDELADLMMTAAKEIEGYIVRLAQKSRAVGIHIVLATQRPQATVVTGLIKSNMPSRVGFRVAARMDSRIILDQNGAETLLGEGDMLFLKPGTSDLIRAQGTFLDDAEIKRIVKHLKGVAEPQFHPELTRLKTVDTSEMTRDELFDDAVRVVLETKRGSVSLLQRRLSIGYARASRIIEMMAASGILGQYKGSQAREVVVTLEEYENIRSQMEADGEAGYEDMAEEDDESSEPAYVSEGQREYIAIDSDEE
ncbi:MAG: FtsK/SpoIIIE family DNA translocase [Planctomycetota bacterium]